MLPDLLLKDILMFFDVCRKNWWRALQKMSVGTLSEGRWSAEISGAFDRKN